MLIAYSSLLRADLTNMFERTLSPGPLSAAHAKFESNCKHCHRPFEKVAENKLCTDCHDHEQIRIDITQHSGLHGRVETMRNRECRECHSEHHGRERQLIKLDKQKFRHDDTDFRLDQRHASVKCESCHKPKTHYYDTPHLCLDCHRKKDVHKGEFGKECGSCHQGKEWKQITYDHNKARFKLHGKHRDVECKDCHQNKRYHYDDMSCNACHSKDDKHKKRLGERCEKCHQDSSWKHLRFDHNRDTKYPLRGKHKKTKCLSCHESNPYKTKTDDTCYACHRKDDEHKSKFGKICEDCHDSRRWDKTRFNHDDTNFALNGAHLDAECEQCHGKNASKKLTGFICKDCHNNVDVHDKALGKDCGSCHIARSWIEVPGFDHNLTLFPIKGEHKDAMCEQCHLDNQYKDTERKCFSCHQTSERHGMMFSDKCEACHLVTGWMQWQFDHDKKTKFALRGAHKKLDCYRCHQLNQPEPRKQCNACHLLDDIHNGSFGELCQRCHNQRTFHDARVMP